MTELTIEGARERLDQLIRELATITQGAIWAEAVLLVYDGRERLIGKHFTSRAEAPSSFDPAAASLLAAPLR